jgi:uncharacterized protein YggT (Ycf19 family)
MRDPKRAASSLSMLFVGLAEMVLAVRVVFRLLDADSTNSLVQWIYAMSAPLLEPIENFIGPQVFKQRFVLDFRTLLAMAFWAVLGYITLAFIEWAKKPKYERESGWRRWLRNVI